MLSARLAGASKASKCRMSKGKVKFCDFQKKSPKKQPYVLCIKNYTESNFMILNNTSLQQGTSKKKFSAVTKQINP